MVHRYKQVKQELATIRAESVVLSRTEQILRSRDANLSDLLKKIEACTYHLTRESIEWEEESATEAEKEADANIDTHAPLGAFARSSDLRRCPHPV